MNANMNELFSTENTVTPVMVEVLAHIANDLRRIADHFNPPPADIVDSRYLADHLGLTTARIVQMVREGKIPKNCLVVGSGDGRPWKFHRRQMEQWLQSR